MPTRSSLLAAIALVATLVPSAAHASGCTPATSSITPNALTATVWTNPYEAIVYEWHGSALAVVSDDCASRLDITVQITDHAELGNPQDVAGDPAPAWDGTAADGEFRAYREAVDWVLYYDPVELYVRGASVVELKVTATYYDPVAQATVPLGCKVTYSEVTPLLTSPRVTTGPVEDCS